MNKFCPCVTNDMTAEHTLGFFVDYNFEETFWLPGYGCFS